VLGPEARQIEIAQNNLTENQVVWTLGIPKAEQIRFRSVFWRQSWVPFVEAVLWIVRTGSPWRDLPDVFGECNSVFRRFSRWSQKGVWWRMFAAMSDDPDFEYLIVDSTVIRAHQHAAGAKKGLKIRPLAAPVAV
jgi:transposase